MQHHAADERHALSETLRAVGPDAPTLCSGWATPQLAAHLVLRERSVIEVAGRLPFAGARRRAEQVVANCAASTPYAELVDTFDRGPHWRDGSGPVPTAWLWSIPVVREQANVLEYLVHHEDVRRAQPDWSARPLSVALQETVWQRLHLLSRATLRAAPVGVELVWPSNGSIRTGRARKHGVAVTVTGDPVELALFSFGRSGVADVAYDGAEDDVAAVRSAELGI